MRLEIELKCILLTLIILEMFLQLESVCGKGPTVDSACQSKNQAMRAKELFVELRDRIVSKHRSWEGYQNISAPLKFPKTTVASIVLNWKNYGTTKTLPRAGRLAKLSNRGRKAVVREVTKNPMVTHTEL